MTFELQHSDIPQAKLLDEEVTTTQWPLPPAKPWAPKSSIEQMCEEALERLAEKLDSEVFRAKNSVSFSFGMLWGKYGPRDSPSGISYWGRP